MNNKEFLTELSGKCQMSPEVAAGHVQTLIGVMENLWNSGDSVSLSGFGVLEVKKKNNHGRTKKKRIQVPSLEQSQTTEGAEELVKKKTGLSFATMHQVVQNLFDRITLVNKEKTERLTIDYNIRFHNFETNNDADSDQLVIIELKRDGNVYSPICSLLRDLHIHPTGFSKCCIGMVWTDPGLKQNNFKAKVRRLAKINQDEREWTTHTTN